MNKKYFTRTFKVVDGVEEEVTLKRNIFNRITEYEDIILNIIDNEQLLNDRERKFIDGLTNKQDNYNLSEKQLDWLTNIEEKINKEIEKIT